MSMSKRGLVFVLMALVFSTFSGTTTLLVAQGSSVDVAIYTVEKGQSAYDVCYVLVGYSNEGCDRNADGKVTFADIPFGTYTVQQTADLGPGRTVPDFTITVTGNVNSEGYEGFTATIVNTDDRIPMDIGARGPNGHEIGALFTVATMNGIDLGSCVLEGVGDEPWPVVCVVDVPLDTTVVVTLDVTTITSGYAPVENPLYFDTSTGPGGASHWGVFFDIEPTAGSIGAGQTSNVAIVTNENGQPAYDACYVFVGYSNEGCDRNADGMITFEDIPLGTWTVRQTADLGPGRSVADFTVQVTGAASGDGWERFPATIVASESFDMSGSSSSPPIGSVDIALITRDPDTGGLLPSACYVLVGYSNEGCDENSDGQVTYADIPFGTYTVHQTQAPAGYLMINDYEIHVEPLQAVESFELVGYPLSFVVKQAPQQNAPNTRNVSVVLIDARTDERVQDEFCLEIVGASNEGCDRDLPDGQIDFLDVPTGGLYEINFTRIPPGYNVDLTFDGGPWLVKVNDGPEYPANKMAFVLVASPDSASGSTNQGGGGNISGQGTYDDMVGEWFGKRRNVTLNADGTGTIDYRRDAFGNGLTYTVRVDPETSPVTATIANVSPYGDIDLSRYPSVGDTVTLELQIFPDGALLVVDMNHDGWMLQVCSADEGNNNVQGLCY